MSFDTTYYWQVRAVNISGQTYADSGVIWQFHTITSPPTPFVKLEPLTGSVDEPTNPTLEWSPSTDATGYYYCLDTTDNNTCDTSWTPAGTQTSIDLSGLAYATTYYWQVYADNSQGQVYADGGTWWSFTTISGLPADFNKFNPVDGAVNQSLTPHLYYWSPEPEGNGTTFSYCINTAPNCSGSWVIVNENDPIVITSSLAFDTTYYWQVKAQNNVGTTYADGSGEAGWWSFTTHLAPPTSSNQSFSVAEDHTLSTSLSASSGYQSLTFTLVGGLPAGSLHLNSDGSFTYTPAANFNGTASFQFLVSDGYNPPVGPYTATITVTPVPDAPVLNDIPDQVVNAGDLLVFLATATDADTPYGDTLTFSLAAPNPLPAGVQMGTNGIFSWAVPETFNPGVYSFTAKVTDSTGLFDTKTFDVIVSSGVPVTGGQSIFLPFIKS